jgi:hypothetical protein
MPNLLYIRPCDTEETAGAFIAALEARNTPSILSLSRQNLEQYPQYTNRQGVLKGAYVLIEEDDADVTLIGVGAEIDDHAPWCDFDFVTKDLPFAPANLADSVRGFDLVVDCTGAAPMTFSDHVALPFKLGFARVYETFLQAGVARDVVWIGSGKLGFPDRTVVALAMGCDMIAIAREAMLSIGCIQSRACHTSECPSGVATMNEWRQRGLDVDGKSLRCATFIRGFRRELLALAHTAGYEHPAQFKGQDIEFSVGVNKFETLEAVLGYRKDDVPFPGMKALGPTAAHGERRLEVEAGSHEAATTEVKEES